MENATLSEKEIENLIRIADYQAKYDFRVFVKRAFHVLDSGTPLSWNWHLDYLCHLATKSQCHILPQEALDIANLNKEDHIRRLIINIPPRSMKSIIFSVCLKAWVLGHNPAFRSIGASYSAALAKGFNRDILRLIECDWYKRIFPDVEMTKTSEPEMETTYNGKMIATSTGGTATGRGGNLLTADDLLNPEQANSDADRLFSNGWMTGTYNSRLNDKKNGTIIIIQQRLHEEDTTGTLIEATKIFPDEHPKKWVLVKLPSIAPEDNKYYYYHTSFSVKKGDILHPDRQDKEDLDGELMTMGDLKFAGQYLQEPAPLEGGILNPAKLKFYHTLPKLTEENTGTFRILQSWDTAIKVLAHHDFSVCTTWLQTNEGFFLMDLYRDKLEYPELKETVIHMAQKFKPAIVLIEDKSSGQQLIQELTAPNNPHHLPIIPVKPFTDKVTRAMSIGPLLKSGSIYVKSHPQYHDLPPKNEEWYQEMVREMAKFPNSRHDDIIDSFSQAINWARDFSLSMPKIRHL